jgi:hypothetical protein
VLATQKIREILNQSAKNKSQEKSSLKIDIDLSKYFSQDIAETTNPNIILNKNEATASFKKYPLFNIKKEKTNVIRDKSYKKLGPEQEKLLQQVSYDEYCTLWKGIATSKASQFDENAYLKTNLLENPNLLSQHLSISLKDLEEQVYQQLKDHKNIIYGKFDFSDRNIDKLLTGGMPPQKTIQSQSPNKNLKIKPQQHSYNNEDQFESEVDELINWTKNIVA